MQHSLSCSSVIGRWGTSLVCKMLDFEVGSNKIKLSNQNGDLRFREMVWVWIPPIWRAVLSLFYPPVIVRGKNGKNSENPVGSNKSEKRKPKSAVYRSFWASVVYFHLRLISTKSHKGEMTRNHVSTLEVQTAEKPVTMRVCGQVQIVNWGLFYPVVLPNFHGLNFAGKWL